MYSMIMLKNKFISFLLFAIVTYSASFIGSIATISYKEPWYSGLNKSFLTPPDWVFAPVWTTLYLFMTIAIWAAWHKNYKNINLVLIYFIHLCFNTTWSIVFFVFHQILLAMIVLIFLIGLIIFLMICFKRVNMTSFYLMVPYLLWCCYALILNTSIYLLN